MDFFEALRKRRSVKQFDANFQMPKADEDKIFEVVGLTPSSFNIQHWRFVALRDAALRKKIREEFGNNQAQITDASLLLLLTADTKAYKKNPKRYWSGAPKDVSDLLVGWMGPFHEGREWLQRDEAQRSIGFVGQSIMLAATSLGYESCPMIGFDIEKVAALINLPEDHVMGPMIAIGKGTQEAHPRQGIVPLAELMVTDTF